MEQLQGSIVLTEKLIKNCSAENLDSNHKIEMIKSTEFSFISNAHDLLINIFRFGVRYLLLKNRVKNRAAKKITSFLRYVINQKHDEMIYSFIQKLYESYDAKVRKEVKISLELMIFKTVESYKASKAHTESSKNLKKLIAPPKKSDSLTSSEHSQNESRRKISISKRVYEIKKISEPSNPSLGELKLKIDNSSSELVKSKEIEISQSHKGKIDSSTIDESKDKLPAHRRKFIAKRY